MSSFLERREALRIADEAVAWGARLPGVRAAGLAARALVLAASGAKVAVVARAVGDAEVALNANDDLLRLGLLWVDLARVGYGGPEDAERGVALLEACGAVGVAREARRTAGMAASTVAPAAVSVESEPPARGETLVVETPASPTGTTQRSGQRAG